MSLEELKQELNLALEKASHPYEKAPGYEHCRNYLNNNILLCSLDHFTKIDIWDCASCLYYIKSKGSLPIEECLEEFQNLNHCINDFTFRDLSGFLDIIMLVSTFEDKGPVISYITEKDDGEAAIKLAVLMDGFSEELDDPRNVETMRIYLTLMRDANTRGDVLKLFDFIDKNYSLSCEIFAYIRSYFELKFFSEEFKKMGEKYILPDKEKNKAFSKFCKDQFDSSAILGEQNIIIGFVNEEDRKEKNYARNAIKLKNGIQDLLFHLEEEDKKKEIANCRKLIRNIKDPELQRKVLEYIYSHNQIYYQELENELNELSSNSLNLYQGVLSKYNISIHSSKIPDIIHHSLEELESILSMIPKGLFDDIEILFILKYTTMKIVERIKKFIDLGFIEKDFIKAHPDFYQEGSKLLSKYEESLQFMNQHGINPKNFRENPIILTLNLEQFKKNILGLEEYDYLKYLKTTDDYHFLLDTNLISKIDFILELGFEKYLVQDFGILNYDIQRFKRFELLKKMNMPITDLEGFMEILESNKFIVSDQELDSYLLNVTPYMKEVESIVSIEDLESYRDKSIYSFDGIAISYPKVKRKLMEGYSLKDAICFQKNMSIDEMKKIIEILHPSYGNFMGNN